MPGRREYGEPAFGRRMPVSRSCRARRQGARSGPGQVAADRALLPREAAGGGKKGTGFVWSLPEQGGIRLSMFALAPRPLARSSLLLRGGSFAPPLVGAVASSAPAGSPSTTAELTPSGWVVFASAGWAPGALESAFAPGLSLSFSSGNASPKAPSHTRLRTAIATGRNARGRECPPRGRRRWSVGAGDARGTRVTTAESSACRLDFWREREESERLGDVPEGAQSHGDGIS